MNVRQHADMHDVASTPDMIRNVREIDQSLTRFECPNRFACSNRFRIG